MPNNISDPSITYGQAFQNMYFHPIDFYNSNSSIYGEVSSFGDVLANMATLGRLTQSQASKIAQSSTKTVFANTYQTAKNNGASDEQATAQAAAASEAAINEVLDFVDQHEGGTAEDYVADIADSVKWWSGGIGAILILALVFLILHEYRSL